LKLQLMRYSGGLTVAIGKNLNHLIHTDPAHFD
jgi:hypothetical protein